ncbi:MAG TPA: hypothetical protein VMR86_04980 [Myxococcota bacterium]|nr:hypothetical protein [Myxococcota bacterium]
MLWLLRASVWLCVSAGMLLAGFALFASVLLVPSVIANGNLPAPVQRQALATVYSLIALQALLPDLAITFAVWLALAWAFPRLDRSWRGLIAGMPLVAALGFPAVGHYLFTIWTPGGARDYALTVVLIAFGVSAALLAPRALSRALGPGCFTIASKRGMVDAP